MKNLLTPAHIHDVLLDVLAIANGATDRHTETNRNVTATLKIQLKFDKDLCRSEWRAMCAVDIPDGELDSEIKRTDSTLLCTLFSGDPGQQTIPGTNPVEDLQKTVDKLGVDMTITAGGKSVTIHGRKGKKVGKEAAAGPE